MNFNDDEAIVTLQSSGLNVQVQKLPGKLQLTTKRNEGAPLIETPFNVMLELTGGESTKDRPGLDLVAVLDISGSMNDDNKIGKLKNAMLFVIKKLGPIDRLSVVTFSTDAARLFPLRLVTEQSQPELEKVINNLSAGGYTDIGRGLETGLKVLNDRSTKVGRVAGIILMSDGKNFPKLQPFVDPTKVNVANVAVHTFGFGKDHDPTVLQAIAANNREGTFSEVQNLENLTKCFGRCLAGLLTVAVQDLKLTLQPIKDSSTIQKVYAGSYLQSKDTATGSVTVTFGNLYSREVRRVVVDLLLPAIDDDATPLILEATYSYSDGSKPFSSTVTVVVPRSGSVEDDQEENPEVKSEMTRIGYVSTIKEARVLADSQKMDAAREKVVEAQNMLEDVPSSPLIETLKAEAQQILNLMNPSTYKTQGLPFILACESSHDRQRVAGRGENAEVLGAYSTPRMDKYVEEASSFDEDPDNYVPPSADKDEKEELVANPLAPIVGPVSFYIQNAIQALQAINELLNGGL